MSSTTAMPTPGSKLLYKDESYFSENTFYKRSHLLQKTYSSSSFSRRFSSGNNRSRSSSYASLDDNDSTVSIFSRKNLGMTGERFNTVPPASYLNKQKVVKQEQEEEEEEDHSDESAFFSKKNSSYSRQNLASRSNSSSSWKSCVLRAVGVKSSR